MGISKVRLQFKLTRWKVCFAVVTLIICSSVSALVNHYKYKPVSEISSEITSKSTGDFFCVFGQPDCPKQSKTAAPTQTTESAEPKISPQSTNITEPSASTQSQSNCKWEEIPYKTTYQDATYLKKGETQEGGGHNGFITYCGNEKPFIVNPVDKIIYVGTGLTDAEIQQQQIAAQQELDARQAQWNRDYASAYQSCLSSLPNNYPSRESFCADQASQQVGSYPR